MTIAPAILSVAVAGAGWYYLFHSRAAQRLGMVESEPANRARQRNRQLAGFLMMPMSVLFFAGSYFVDSADRPGAFVAIWISVMILLMAVIILAVNDLRLTARLRRGKPQ